VQPRLFQNERFHLATGGKGGESRQNVVPVAKIKRGSSLARDPITGGEKRKVSTQHGVGGEAQIRRLAKGAGEGGKCYCIQPVAFDTLWKNDGRPPKSLKKELKTGGTHLFKKQRIRETGSYRRGPGSGTRVNRHGPLLISRT